MLNTQVHYVATAKENFKLTTTFGSTMAACNVTMLDVFRRKAFNFIQKKNFLILKTKFSKRISDSTKSEKNKQNRFKKIRAPRWAPSVTNLVKYYILLHMPKFYSPDSSTPYLLTFTDPSVKYG